MGRTLLAVGALTLALLRPAGAAAAGKQDVVVAMDDGVPIAATLYEPEGPPPEGGWPAVLLLHGLGGSRSAPDGIGVSPDALAENGLVPRGYAVLTFDARAHGASGGLFSLDGPREIADVRALFTWLTARPEIDPKRVGAIGVSYGGGAVLRATVQKVPFAAVVAAATWTDLAAALFPQGLVRSGTVAELAAALPASRVAPQIRGALADLSRNAGLAQAQKLARARSTRALLDRIRTPVFLLQGRRDFTFDLGQAFAGYVRLRGPKRLYVGNLGHGASTSAGEQEHYLTEIELWLDRFLKGERNGIVRQPRIEVAPDPWTGTTVSYKRVPPRKAVRLALPGRATLGPTGKAVRSVALPGRRLEEFGAPVVAVTAWSTSSWDHIVAVLSALTPQGAEVVLSEGGAATPMLSPRPRTIAFPLTDTAVPIPPRSRLRVTIAAASTAQSPLNQLYLLGVDGKSLITIGNVRVTLPVLATPISR